MKDFFELREGKATKTEDKGQFIYAAKQAKAKGCLLYTSPSPRDREKSRMPSSA